MTEHVDHVVVGGGVMGSAAAWHLARRGRQVVLLERFGPGHDHGASHGSSRIYRTTYPEPVYLDLAQEALTLWRLLEAESGEALLEITGGVSHARPGLPSARRTEQVAQAFAARGIPFEWLDPAEASRRWPGLRFEGRVLHETATAGRLHADRAVSVLQRRAAASGADVRHDTPVRHLERVGDRVLVVTQHDELLARRVVVAVGAWSAGVLAQVLDDERDPRDPSGRARRPGPAADGFLPLVVTQEQPAHFAPRDPAVLDGTAAWPSFTHDPGPQEGFPSGVYGLAAPGEGVKVGFHAVGPRVDPDRRDRTPEPAQLAALRRYVRSWLPGLDPDVFEPVSCTYTTTPDHDFVLDRRGPVVVAAGSSGHGFKFAPSVGRVLADLADLSRRPEAVPPARVASRDLEVGGVSAGRGSPHPVRPDLARFALARFAATRTLVAP